MSKSLAPFDGTASVAIASVKVMPGTEGRFENRFANCARRLRDMGSVVAAGWNGTRLDVVFKMSEPVGFPTDGRPEEMLAFLLVGLLPEDMRGDVEAYADFDPQEWDWSFPEMALLACASLDRHQGGDDCKPDGTLCYCEDVYEECGNRARGLVLGALAEEVL